MAEGRTGKTMQKLHEIQMEPGLCALRIAALRQAGAAWSQRAEIHASPSLAGISWRRFARTTLRSIAASWPSCPRIRRSSRVNSFRRTQQGSRSPEGARS